MTATTLHNGDLGHNASVAYIDDRYEDDDGESFFLESISISDKMRHVVLIPLEALSLLGWLQQEREHLQQLVKEQEG